MAAAAAEDEQGTAAEILRRNDPAVDKIFICLRLENDVELARAIEQNEYVTVQKSPWS